VTERVERRRGHAADSLGGETLDLLEVEHQREAVDEGVGGQIAHARHANLASSGGPTRIG